MRDLVFLPINLIKEAEQEGWLRSLAYFVRCKSLYQNNTHYNYSLRTLGERIKCSPACLSVHLKVLEGKGLIRFHSGNLTFLGLWKLRTKWKWATIGVPVDFKNQHDVLRCQIIRFNLNEQQHKISNNGLLNWRGGFVPSTKAEKDESCYAGLSVNRIGELIGRTRATGSRIRQKLSSLNYLSVRRVYSVLYSGVSYSDYIFMRNNVIIPYYSFYKEGRICVQRRCMMEYTPPIVCIKN